MILRIGYCMWSLLTSAFAIQENYDIDAAAAGPIFDGIGAISGGGGETVLLPAYPEPQRSQVLDYLFRPSFGASLQILKVEIGGDGLSTDGAEPSHMHSEDEFQKPDFDRGYEWWVMEQAKRINPSMLLYGLPWEFPLWVGGGAETPYANLTRATHYTVEWVRGAAAKGMPLDFLGIWNEREADPDYVVALRAALNEAGHLHTALVAPDQNEKSFIDNVLSREDLSAAVHALGFHYPDTGLKVPSNAAQTGKRLWSSEDYSTVSVPMSAPKTEHLRERQGGGCLARIINQNYVRGNMTATIVWNLVMARYPQMRWDYAALMTAMDPFGGHYDVGPAIWAAAHTTQFTMPGWRLLQVGQGSGWMNKGGSYVGYVGPSGELSVVIEKLSTGASECQRSKLPDDHAVTGPENATFEIHGLNSVPKHLALWASHFGHNQMSAPLFEHRGSVTVVNGTVRLSVEVDWVYTLSTIMSASKGDHGEIPAVGAFPKKYSDNFDECASGSMPRYVSPMAGAFECVDASGGRDGKAVRQMSPAKGYDDRGDVVPFALLGDGFRETYNLSADVLLLSPGVGAFVAARVKGPVGARAPQKGRCETPHGMSGVFLGVNATGWQVTFGVGDLGKTLAFEGKTPSSISLADGKWHRLGLQVEGTTAKGSVDGVLLFDQLAVPAPQAVKNGFCDSLGKGGYAAFGTVGYGAVEFDALEINSGKGEAEIVQLV